ncbi:lmo0937 family membrane protein [Craterilacuibacter sinensis]|uniref:Lmo0937 family membrane protein n=1 Tax=Craterilacuibacter sinensis TaxID=2686017 RepID=A0A845BHM6_9NEIS|nr:lmo0937 family membrane protein [Craterilacuibacter sinensis]MXR36227.1 lmo0937 family membrane protein [Craterilacuibacter sinensis]
MLATIAVILLILWLLGLVSSYTLGGFIHILLVIAVVIFLVRLATSRS